MWASIEEVVKPESFAETLEYLHRPGSILFAGGSYLVAKKDSEIRTLLDINHLLNDEISSIDGEIHVGAGCNFQKLVRFDNTSLSHAIIRSCPSKNIRNQRTLGGEIAQFRSDSDLLVYLFAAQTKVRIHGSVELIPISDWRSKGIITDLIIPQDPVQMERVSVLDSAPAYVIVGVKQIGESISIAVGGKTNRILSCSTELRPDEAQIRQFMDNVKSLFQDDHFGNTDYKQHIVSKLLQEMVVVK